MMIELFPANVQMTPSAARLHEPQAILQPGRQAPLDLTIFISCYNEQDLILATIETVRVALAEVGNLSSASVLHILEMISDTERPPAGSPGLMIGLGPGVSAELVLLQWLSTGSC